MLTLVLGCVAGETSKQHNKARNITADVLSTSSKFGWTLPLNAYDMVPNKEVIIYQDGGCFMLLLKLSLANAECPM